MITEVNVTSSKGILKEFLFIHVIEGRIHHMLKNVISFILKREQKVWPFGINI